MRCKPCSKRAERNPKWKGDQARHDTGHGRAQRKISLKGVICERCDEAPASDRHHIDANRLNNDPTNIMRLCRRCHMEEDGRLEALRARNSSGRRRRKKNPIRYLKAA